MDEQFLVFAAMRNEGPFIVEWVSWYRSLGFDVLIATNDCTDHSVELLDQLAEAGWLTHFSHSPAEDQPPKLSAHFAARRHPIVMTADWVLVCDVDEFLVLHRGDGSIQSFVGDGPRDYLGMAFSWRCFGNGGWKRYHDGLVHRQFRRVSAPHLQINAQFKSMFRNAVQFDRLGAHTPHGFEGVWGVGSNRWIDSAGRELEQFNDPDNHPIRHLRRDQITHETAQMNHYVIRSDESFDLKRGTPSASALKDRYTDTFYKARNRNGQKDITALDHAARFDPVHAAAMDLPGVRRLHHLCCADYVASLCANQNRPHAEDERWQMHMAEAEKG